MSFLLNLFSSLPSPIVQPALCEFVERRTCTLIPCNSHIHEKKESDHYTQQRRPLFPALRDFVQRIVQLTKTLPSTLLAALVYLERLAKRLPSRAYGHKEATYRVFTAALILATKFLQDGAMKNTTWAAYLTPWFEASELTVMERQFLRCIDFDLAVRPEHLSGLILTDPTLCGLIYWMHCPLNGAGPLLTLQSDPQAFYWQEEEDEGQHHQDKYLPRPIAPSLVDPPLYATATLTPLLRTSAPAVMGPAGNKGIIPPSLDILSLPTNGITPIPPLWGLSPFPTAAAYL